MSLDTLFVVLKRNLMTQLWEYFIYLELMIMKKPQRTQYMKYSQDRIMSPLSKPVYFFIYPSNVSGMIYHAKSHSQITTVIVSKVRDDELQMSNVLGP